MKIFFSFIVVLCLFACGSISKFEHGQFDAPKTAYSFPIESIDGIIVLRVEVNGIEGRFMLDNGFSLCALDREFADRASVKHRKTSTVNDANNNNVRLEEVQVESIKLGAFNLQNSFANILETNVFLPCDDIDGVLGASFINRLNWKFDFEHMQATATSMDIKPVGHALPFTVASNNISHTTIHVNGHPVNAMIDFGFQGHVQLRKEKFLDLFQGMQAEVRQGIHSISVAGLGNVDTIFYFNEIPVSSCTETLAPSTEVILRSHLSNDCVIGVNYFENYSVSIDNKNHRYYLEPRGDYKGSEEPNFNVSLYVLNGSLKVLQVNINDAVADQVELLQTVKSIDGRPSAEFTDLCYLKAYFREKRSLKEKVIVVLEGTNEVLEVTSTSVARKVI